MSVTIQGTCFDGETLSGRPVTLTVSAGRLLNSDAPACVNASLAEIRTSDRLGHVPRYLYLPGGQTVETPDNDAVDALLASQRRGRLVALIHGLEMHHQVAAAATLLLVIAVSFTVWWGLPVLARRAAMAAPEAIERQAGRAALSTINQILPQSQLTPSERNRVIVVTERLRKAAGLAQSPELVFRSMGGQTPNAFALPGGIIVVSDELVRLTKIDDEIAAVLAHEIGHARHRHGIQGILRNSAALLVVSTVTGDLSTLTTFAGTLPFLLLQRGYSREFEIEADDYALDLMDRMGIGAHHFGSILKKLETARPTQGNDFTYLSTHPSTAERISRIKARAPIPPPAGSGEVSLPADDAPEFADEVNPANEPINVQPAALFRPPPQYPALMRAARLHGDVTIEFVIDRNGVVRDPLVVRSTYKEFEAPAIAAIKQWRYTPGQKNGRKVNVRASQLFEFNLDDEPSPPEFSPLPK
ncbi:MAG TPA: TonB family protein [Lacunisphaera sp.]